MAALNARLNYCLILTVIYLVSIILSIVIFKQRITKLKKNSSNFQVLYKKIEHK